MKTHLIRRDIQQLHLNMSHEHTSISKVKKLQTNLIYYLNEKTRVATNWQATNKEETIELKRKTQVTFVSAGLLCLFFFHKIYP